MLLMKSKSLLKHTIKLLTIDVQSFRNIVLASEGGELPKEIREKEKLLRELTFWLKSSTK
jgi:hypothetical protein